MLSGLSSILLISMLTIALPISPVLAAAPEKTSGFICPVLGGDAGENGNSDKQPFVTIAGGDTTVIGPNVYVPTHSTNQDGSGSPGEEHASPGDKGYSPIWATP